MLRMSSPFFFSTALPNFDLGNFSDESRHLPYMAMYSVTLI